MYSSITLRPVVCRGPHEMFWTGKWRVRGNGDYRYWYERRCRRCPATGWALTRNG